MYYVTMQITFPIPEYTTSHFRSAHAHARSRADILRSMRIISTSTPCLPVLMMLGVAVLLHLHDYKYD